MFVISKSSKGFTIIELIVVIAIIAVLAAIVMVNVTQYIAKSKDSAIKADMDNVTTLAAQYQIDHGNYVGFCDYWNSSSGYTAISNLTPHTGQQFCTNNSSTGDVWAACATLNVDERGLGHGTAWCSDSTGDRRIINDRGCGDGIASGGYTNCKAAEND